MICCEKISVMKNVKLNRIAKLFVEGLLFGLCFIFCSCAKKLPELTLEEIEQVREANVNFSVLDRTVSKPYKGQKFKNGIAGGEWYSSVTAEPKTFNYVIADNDGASSDLIEMLTDSLSSYDLNLGQWKPELADSEIVIDEENDTMDVKFTLRSDIYWSFIDSDRKIPVTSDDVVFWYDKIEGNPKFSLSGYNSQFVKMKDGSEKRITVEKIDSKSFVFHYPRIVANPMLSTNQTIKPSFLYQEAFEKGGVQAVKDLFNVSSDVKKLPSCGMWFLQEYVPGQRLVYVRNHDYWEKDDNGVGIPYREKLIVQIVSDANTQLLLFKQGKQDAYAVSPREVSSLAANQDGFTLYNSEGAPGSGFWSFNQNPKNKAEPYYNWFTKKEFRQAMSCIVNRDRLIAQTYRSLGKAKYDFFPKGNPFYNEKIQLKYKYNLEMAQNLLKKAGFSMHEDGFLYDSNGIKVVFDISIPSSVPVNSDIAQILADECLKVGITLNVRQLDFQKLIEQLTGTYDWQSVIIALGVNFWPSQGPNVWLSNGPLHLWYPLQKEPATEWEARIDYLYNEGSFTIDTEKAQKIWDEYQRIMLEQCPVIYLISPRTFFAIRNKWNQTNFYFDSLHGSMTERIWLAQ